MTWVHMLSGVIYVFVVGTKRLSMVRMLDCHAAATMRLTRIMYATGNGKET